MKFRSLDVNNDWEFGRGVSSYASDADALALNLATRLRSWVGNCFFDLDMGVDYLNLLGPGTKDDLSDAIQNVILGTDGVMAINTYDQQIDAAIRKSMVNASIYTIFSPSFLAQIQLLASPLGGT